MFLQKRFPHALAVCLVVCSFAANAAAQSSEFSRARQVAPTYTPDGASRLETDVFLVSEAVPVSPSPAKTDILRPLPGGARIFQFNHSLMSAIENRLGAPYVYGATGPNVFDCSGFVWSVFQSAGIQFDRVSARDLWSQFAPPREDEKFKLGTLVFFNNLKHVGIVADANGFYHASSSHGVQYAPFNDYWMSRVVGFRRIPLPTPQVGE
jgi:cell wall-associated NlpC family hydrolase